MSKGVMKEDYLKFINYPPKQFKPSAIKLFPAVGMIDTKQTYTTTNMVDNIPISIDPNGFDEFTRNYSYHDRNKTDIGKLKDVEIRIKDSLLARKHKRIK